MENASKALIMGAEILIGIMIISIGVYLFNTLGSYSAETAKKMEDAQIAQFNNQFLKYYGTVSTQKGDKIEQEFIKCTIHDIIDLANLARKINEESGFTTVQKITDYENYPNIYVQIDLKIGNENITNLEGKNQSFLLNLIKNNDITEDINGEPIPKYFYCKDEPKISNITKRVNYMKFVEI